MQGILLRAHVVGGSGVIASASTLYRSWTDQYLVYIYGTWVILVLEIIWCQLFVGLGMQPAQLHRRSGAIRGAIVQLLCWRQLREAPVAEQVLPVTAPPKAEAAADAGAKVVGKEPTEAGGNEAAKAASAAPQQTGELEEMNLSDALSGGAPDAAACWLRLLVVTHTRTCWIHTPAAVVEPVAVL